MNWQGSGRRRRVRIRVRRRVRRKVIRSLSMVMRTSKRKMEGIPDRGAE